MELRFEMEADDSLMKKHGLGVGGRVQKFIDQECIRRMDPYTPRITGALIKSATTGSKIGSGKIVQAGPYARYLYYGKLMVSKETGSAYAAHGESKVLTDKDLKYSQAANPNAGRLWFARMTADHKREILAGAQKFIGGGK